MWAHYTECKVRSLVPVRDLKANLLSDQESIHGMILNSLPLALVPSLAVGCSTDRSHTDGLTIECK